MALLLEIKLLFYCIVVWVSILDFYKVLVMTHRWKQTIDINEQMVRKLLETQHHLSIDTLTLLDEGWDNQVYLINKRLIFRFPRREFGVMCMENEIALLPHIATRVSFPLSNPQWIGHASALYPYPFAGYSIIPGKPLCEVATSLVDDSHFALTLAAWLRELHAVMVSHDEAALIKGGQTWRIDIQHRVATGQENINQYEKYFLQAGFEKNLLNDVIEQMRYFKFNDMKKSYLHGDLYSRHIIVNPTGFSLAGLIDWGDIHVGDPGIDLAAGMIFTESSFNLFLNAYENINDVTFKIMLFHAFFHALSFLPYAYEQNKESLKRWVAMTLFRTIHEINKI